MKTRFALTILLLLSGLVGCRESTSSVVVDPPVAIQTFLVKPTNGQGDISVAGVVKPHLEADLAAQIVAPVTSISKREGDRFRKGEVLVRLHAPALGAEVAQANASLGSAEKQAQASEAQATLAAANLSRYTQLRERHSVTAYELDQMKAQSAVAEAQHQSATAQVSAARSALAFQQANESDANLYAPFDGVVTRRMADPGAMAAPGVPLLHVQSTGTLDVEFPVPETLLNSLQVGTDIKVSLGNGTPISARIVTIAPSGDAGSHSFSVKASLPASASWSASTVVQVALPSKSAVPQILVPSSALVQQGGLDAVIAVGPDGSASVRYVTLGTVQGELTEILTGVRPGDRLVTNANLALAGKQIEVRP